MATDVGVAILPIDTSTASVDVIRSWHVSLPMAALGITFVNIRAIVTADGGIATIFLCAMIRPMLNFRTPILALKLGILGFKMRPISSILKAVVQYRRIVAFNALILVVKTPILALKLGILVLKMGGCGYVSFVVGVVVKFQEVGGAPN